ncbi:hypothetical protein [Roseibium sp.]|uniref:hypothetical protein n=1 Tax=Roseibium sp. TaxID=1936156 RepID=UPI003B50EC47
MARIALYNAVSTMAIIKRSTPEIYKIDSTSSFNRLLMEDGCNLKNRPYLIEQLQILHNPVYAASVVQKRIDPLRCTWVEIRKATDAIQREIQNTLRDLYQAWRNKYLDLSAFRDLSETWKSAVIEAVIWNRGAPLVRSAAQAHVYRMSRCELHQLKAQIYDLKQLETTQHHLVKRLSAA